MNGDIGGCIVSASLRHADLVARYGGEEFVLLLSQTPRRGAEHIAHRILDAIETLGPRSTAGDLLLAADKALYCAKLAGRSRAKLLDIADLNSPQHARAITRSDFAL